MMMGGVISAPTLAALLNGCGPSRTAGWQPSLFTPEQALMVEDIADRIIPTTDTPGAKAAGVPKFIESIVQEVYLQKERDRFLAGLTEVNTKSQEKFSDDFTSLEKEQQNEILNEYNAGLAAEKLPAGHYDNTVNDYNPSFFRMIKELTIEGYYESEIGAKEELAFLRIPGSYKACMPLEEQGKTWAI